MKENLYLSFDIETDGDNPLLRNMISIGFVGMTEQFEEIFSYNANLENLTDHIPDENTMKNFWEKNINAWNETQKDKKHYCLVMNELSNNFKKLHEKYTLKFIAMPACFDWMFFKSYYELARNENSDMYDIGFSCVCISSYFNAYCDFINCSGNHKMELKKRLMEYNYELDHIAIQDARCQVLLYIKTMHLISKN